MNSVFYHKTTFICIVLFLSLLIGVESYGFERENYGKIWNLWPDHTRYVYLLGFHDAVKDITGFINRHYLITDKYSEKEKAIIYETSELLADRWLSRALLGVFRSDRPIDDFGLEEIKGVMNYLYFDPMNTFISFDKMIYFARDKLRGEQIEDKLIKWRKLVNESWMKRKQYLEEKRKK